MLEDKDLKDIVRFMNFSKRFWIIYDIDKTNINFHLKDLGCGDDLSLSYLGLFKVEFEDKDSNQVLNSFFEVVMNTLKDKTLLDEFLTIVEDKNKLKVLKDSKIDFEFLNNKLLMLREIKNSN